MTQTSTYVPASFDSSRAAVEVGPRGQQAHHRQFAQTERFEPRMYAVEPGVWCMVGNGLSNQTFVEGPDGIIAIDRHATLARDAIQFIWDQTVRGINRDLTSGELIEFVQLPACYDDSYLTEQTYGLVEDHSRQVHAGLRGWFDGFEADLFPLPTAERCRRLVAGFGGADQVRAQARAAIADDDLRWGLELATWLVRSEVGADGRADGGDSADRALLATVLRSIAQRTPAANIRNWCLTRARELDGLLDLAYFRSRSFSTAAVLGASPSVFVHDLAVSLVPSPAAGVDIDVAWMFDDGTRCGLHIRHCIAAPTDGARAAHTLHIDHAVWAAVLADRRPLADLLGEGGATVDGDPATFLHTLTLFEVFQPVEHSPRHSEDAPG